MTRTVFCHKLHQELAGMDDAPYPSELGQRIFNHISQKAWDAWINHQTMLINEYRLSLLDPKSKTFLLEEMEKFLFGGGSAKPPGFQESDSE